MKVKYYCTKTFCGVILIIILTCFFVLNQITAFADSPSGSGVYFEIDKNRIDSVKISTSSSKEIMCGATVQLFSDVYPESAEDTVVKTEYKIIDGNAFAEIIGDKLVVYPTTPVGSNIQVISIVDDVESDNSLIFTVKYTPVERVEIANAEDSLVIGGALKIETNVYPTDATNKHILYSISSDTNYMNITYSGVLSFNGRAIPEGDLSVTIRATSTSDPNVYSEKTFSIYRPISEPIDSTRNLNEVNQQNTYSFNTKIPYLFEIFGNNAVKYSVNTSDSIAIVDDVNGLLYINPDAPIGTEFILSIISYDGLIQYDQHLVVAPVYATKFIPAVITEPNINVFGGNYYLPGTVIDFDVLSYEPVNVTDTNKVFTLKVSDERLAYVEGHTVIIRNVANIPVTNPHFTVTVCSEPNGLEQSFEFDVYISLNSVAATAKQDQLNENSTYSLKDIIEYHLNPWNASLDSFSYELLTGTDIATIRNDNLIINDNLPAGDVKVQLYVKINGMRSNVVEFDIYKPARSITLNAEVAGKALSDTNIPISSKKSADTITLITQVDKYASINKSKLVVTKGEEYIDGDIKLVKVIDGLAYFELSLKKNLISTTNNRPYIKLYAIQEGVISQEMEIYIYLPNEDLKISDTTLKRTEGDYHFKQIIPIKPIIPTGATSQQWEFKLSDNAIARGVQKASNDSIYIPLNVGAGNFTILYRAIEGNSRCQSNEWKTVVYTIEALSNTATYIYDGRYKDGFNVQFSNDSKNHIIKSSAPQLWVGRSVNLDIKYGNIGKSILEYGLYIEEPNNSGKILYEDSNAKVTWVDKDTVSVYVKPDADGNAKINVNICVVDNGQRYNLSTISISVYNPLTSSFAMSFNTVTANNTNIKNYFASGVKEKFDKLTGSSALKFEILNLSDNSVEIKNNVIFKVNSYAASGKQYIRCIYTDDNDNYTSYNGVKISDVGLYNVPLTIKTIKINKNSGSGGYDTIVAISGMAGIGDKTMLNKIKPKRDGHDFIGYGSYIDSSGKVLKDYNSCGSLTANWLKTESTIIFSAENGHRDKTITDSDKYVETIYPNMDREALKAHGYTKLEVTITFDAREINDGYQDLWVYSHQDKELRSFTVEHGAGYKDTSWWSHTVKLEISLTHVQTDASFWMRYGAHGNFADDWVLGRTVITVKAKA